MRGEKEKSANNNNTNPFSKFSAGRSSFTTKKSTGSSTNNQNVLIRNPYKKNKTTTNGIGTGRVEALALSSSSSGWISSKKRGRDDEIIEMDRQRVIHARKKGMLQKKKKATTKGKRHNNQDISSSEEEEFGDEMDDFIVDTDDDLQEDDDVVSKESDDHDLSIIGDDHDDDVNKSEEDELEKAEKRLKMRRLQKVRKQNRNISSENNKFASTLSDNKMKNRTNEKSFTSTTSSSPLSTTSVPDSRTATISKYFSRKKTNDLTTVDLVDTPDAPPRTKSRMMTSSPIMLLDDDDNDDKSHAYRSSTNKAKLFDENDYIEDEDEFIAIQLAMNESTKEQRLKSNKKSKKIQRDDSVGRKLLGKKKCNGKIQKKNDTKDVKKKYSVHETKKSLLIDLDSEDESDHSKDQGVEEDEYVDQGEIEAGSVLKEANAISARILSTMIRWCAADTTSEKGPNGQDKSKDTKIPGGLLLADGAIAASSLAHALSEHSKDDHNDDTMSKKDWISSEQIAQICPGLKLADYQLIGVNWMSLLLGMKCDLKENKSSSTGMNVNGVLADEMGLGKTVQTIAFLAWLKKRQAKNSQICPPHIIIVPASVLSNWLREFKQFCPSMVVVKYHGTMTERKKIQRKLKTSLPSSTRFKKGYHEPLDVVLTTYSYFSSEKSDDRSFLQKFDWNYMVVDEAHCLKNPKGARYKNMDRFKTQRRLLLTGTPVQNSPKELMSLLCFLMPLFKRQGSSFDDDKLSNDGGAHMLEHFIHEYSDGKTDGAVDEHAYVKLKQLLSPFVLRRKKIDVLSQIMPPKTRKLEMVPFDKETRKVYDSILSNHLKSCTEKSSKENEFQNYKHIFTALRKAANHPLLLRMRHNSSSEIEHLSKHLYSCGYFGVHETCTQTLVKKELKNFSDYDIHCAALELIEENTLRSKELERYTLQQSDLFCSPKMTRLKKILPELVENGHRMLIFSQWTRCLDLLGCLMDTIGFKFLRLDGSTNINERQGLIDEFNTNTTISVFLLSTRAGGMGINLTAADTCILHDLDFNPFNDLQAEDRCHRIGQKKPVTIIKMVTEDTVDSDIYMMQERKAKMNAAILENKGDPQSSSDGKNSGQEDMNTFVQNALHRFLASPSKGEGTDI